MTGKARVLPEKFTTSYESVVAQGTAAMTEGGEKQRALRLLVEKYAPQFVEEGMTYIEKSGGKPEVVRIDVLSLCGKHAH